MKPARGNLVFQLSLSAAKANKAGPKKAFCPREAKGERQCIANIECKHSTREL